MNKTPNILVVGSFVMDQIMTTAVFPREGQTVLGKAFRKAPGGKGANQAVQMARLGAHVTFVGKVGDDGNGTELLQACREAGVDVSKVMIDPACPSACAVITLHEQPDGSTQNRIIVYPGANMEIRPEDVAFLKEEIAAYDLVVLQLEIPMQINELVAAYAHDKGVPVLLNSAPSAPLPDALLRCLTFLSPNETEAEDLTGVHIAHSGNDADLEQAGKAAAILQEKGVSNILITLGSAGAVLFAGGERIYSPCVSGIHAIDPTAAGDSFIGAFCCAYSSGWSREDALLYANHAAALTVSGMGAMPSIPTAEAIDALLQSRGVSIRSKTVEEVAP